MCRILAAALCALLAGAQLAPAQGAPAKRAEGRYFLELAEVMLNTEDFDVLFGEDDPLGPRAGGPAVPLIAETPSNHLEAPMITLGLNRPSGKSTFSMTFHDFDMDSRYVPPNFDRRGFVTSSNLIPAGIVFQRQAQPNRAPGIDDDYIPNYGTDWAYLLQVDHQMTDFSYERNAFENEKFRLRWIGGLRYGKLSQVLGHALAFAKEQSPTAVSASITTETQDFFFVTGNVSTRGLGPKFGLDGRWLLDAKKKWSIEARADVAYLPETTNTDYQINLVDASSELFRLMFNDPSGGQTVIVRDITEQPVIPGLPTEALETFAQPFAATHQQTDFTEGVLLATGRVGFRYQANRYFGVGLDLWQTRWMNVLSNAQMFATINRDATFDWIPASPGPNPGRPNPDPQLQDSEAILHVPRFTEREDFVFDGINLNLSFQF